VDGYDFREVEERWQRRWDEDGTYRVGLDDPRPPYYVLSMYPYPSGPAHRAISATTPRRRPRPAPHHAGPRRAEPFRLRLVRPSGRERRHQGRDHPRVYTEARISELKASVRRLGAVYDWRRELRSHDPDYMRWNQVIFLELLRAGLAYRAEATGQLVPRVPHSGSPTSRSPADGTCERSGTSSSVATSSSGSSASPTTPRSCWTPSTVSTGPSA